jgi:hypothetical protein
MGDNRTTQAGKGDIRSQRQRRRDRYRGCRVCGVRSVQCTECDLGEQLVAIHGYASLALVVDGSFVPAGKDARNAPRVHRERYAALKVQIANDHPAWTADRVDAALVEALTGAPSTHELGHGGAGLVLVRGKTILASRACGFRAASSSDAEYHAVIRASRWARGVAIYTDARDLPVKMSRVNPDIAVHYLDPNKRADAYALAHRLSVEGRCREAPETIPSVGLAYAAERSNLTKAQRKAKGAELLLEHAQGDPSFDGDFTALAARLGWASGRLWQRNPAIRIASAQWQAQQSEIKRGEEDHVDGL